MRKYLKESWEAFEVGFELEDFIYENRPVVDRGANINLNNL